MNAVSMKMLTFITDTRRLAGDPSFSSASRGRFRFRSGNGRVLGCTAAALFVALLTHAQLDNFDGGSDSLWTHYDPVQTGSWSFLDGGYRIYSEVSPSPASVGPGRAGSFLSGADYSQFMIRVDVVNWDDELDQIFGILARVNTPGLGTTTGYACTYATRTGRAPIGQMELLRVTGERSTRLAAADLNLDAERDYRLVFRGELMEFRAQLFDLADLSAPVATLAASDPAYVSGGVGVFTYDNSPSGANRADVTFDNFLAAELPPRLAIVMRLAFEAEITWPGWATNYILESTPVLPAMEWTDESQFVAKQNGQHIFLDLAWPNNKFYRLRKP